MSTTIKIKRGTGIPTTSALSSYEPGFSTDNENLYISNGSSVVRIGNKVFNGSAAPDSNIGLDGDFYAVTAAASSHLISTDFLQKIEGEWVSVGGGSGGGGGGPSCFTLSTTLSAGATTITFTDSRIEPSNRIYPWASEWGVIPASISVASGSITMIFAARQSAVEVDVDVSGEYPYAEGVYF